MHNSESSANEVASVRLYLDESGGKDPSTPKAVVGGLLINYSHFLHFEEVWDQMLETHGIIAPLHMREFGKGCRLAGISECCRRELFLEVAELVNSHKVGSMSATLTNAEYEAYIPQEIRHVFSPYAMCFNLAMMMNHKLAENVYQKKIPFILDIGNPYKEHIIQAHAAAVQMQRQGEFLHAGGLYFDDDAEFGTLQAADVIAWGIRRTASGLPFLPGTEPIGTILSYEKDHRDNAWKAEWLEQLGDTLLRRLNEARKTLEKNGKSNEGE